MRIKIKSKPGRQLLICNTSRKDVVNQLEADRLYQPVPATLARMEPRTEKDRNLSYDISFCTSLEKYFKQKVDADTIFLLLKQFIEMVHECERLKLNVYKVMFDDFKYIFYHETDRRLKFIYIPLQNTLAMTDTNRLRAFVENLLSKPTYQPNADTAKLLEILNYISVEPRFNINSLELFIQKLENPEEEEKIQSDKPKTSNQHRYMVINSEDITSQPEKKEKGYAVPETTDMSEIQPKDELLTQDGFPYDGLLERVSTKEKIIISGSTFVMGRYEKGMPISEKPDYCLESRTISRGHLKIYKKPGLTINDPDIFEVYDEKSHNRTYINGKLVEHKQYTPLQDGDELSLYNEVFRFRIIKQGEN